MFLRIRKICSSFIDYLNFSLKLIISLCIKGYDFNYLCALSRHVGSKDRLVLLPYKAKNVDNKDNYVVKTFLEFDRSYEFFKRIF